ncbi:MAG: diguanylate cyclase [Lachnospiraceae bacterium]|nr:diguanylate cyclase [Lachnospiraceae bacterium]
MTKWIAIVDDDVTNLKNAGKILSKNHMRVSAMKSGKALLNFIRDNTPDLILLDILMPEMDGFKTFEELRKLEKELGREEIPIVFLTAEEDENIERLGLDIGAADFIRKPFNPNVLLTRIGNIVSNSEKIRDLTEEAITDKLTGFLNKAGVNEKLTEACKVESGALMILDLDSFKLVNDIYGHDMGDRMLAEFGNLVRKNTRSEDVIGRIGGDEFIVFCRHTEAESDIARIVARINDQLVSEAKRLMGSDMNIPLGVSAGVVFVPKQGCDYNEAFRKADKALYYVKQNGKHGYSVYIDDEEDEIVSLSPAESLIRINKILEERNVPNCALLLGQDTFIQVYRYVYRYIQTYKVDAFKLLFSISPTENGVMKTRFSELADSFADILQNSLRKSDIMMRNQINQFFVLLIEVNKDNIEKVVDRFLHTWENSVNADKLHVIYEVEKVDFSEHKENDARRGNA